VTKRLPQRHWRSYGNDPLPTPADALAEPFRAFPSWFLRIECDRVRERPHGNESHTAIGHCTTSSSACATTVVAGGPGRAELLTGIDGASSRPVRQIVLAAG
jgi:hypothetical protein